MAELNTNGSIAGIKELIDTVVAGIGESRRLRAADEDESKPYEKKYKAAEILQALEERAIQLTPNEPKCSSVISHCMAFCQLERGLVLLETDLTADGQKALQQALECTWPATAETYAIQQQAHNALGGLWCSREEFDTSLQHLKMAEELYSKVKATCASRDGKAAETAAKQQQQGEQQQLNLQGPECSSSATSSCDSWPDALADVEQVETHYTTTLYFMAQVYGHAGEKVLSAAYCAATLNRQLKQGAVDVNDWVQNSLQLSGYFLDCNAFALSQYCCAAVKKMLLQWHEKQQSDVAQSAGCDGDQQQQPAASEQHEQQPLLQAAEGASDSSEAAAADGEQQQQQQQDQDGLGRDQAGKQQQQQSLIKAAKAGKQQQGVGDGLQSSSRLQQVLQCLEEDVAANVRLAFAKLNLYCLVASHERHIEGKQLLYIFAGPEDVPAALSFDALPDLPQLPSLAWGDAALAADSQDALGLFKAALPWFKQALEYYKLEGWVTEHCHILFEMSNLYRCLAGFESDPHKRCVMHKHRAKLLVPLEGQLSPTHYPGLSRSISLELGNIFREIGDIKAAAGREQEKVAAAGVSASHHYQLFLDSFKGPDGQLPDKVEPEMEQHFLSAAFCLARVLQSSAGQHKERKDQVEALQHALAWLHTVVAYVERNKVTAWQQEAQLAGEMAGLLQEKLALTCRLQSN